ncbi:MAG: pre-peptidase C-terminal domain-containing protein [Sandaracinaceae bacterium]
MRPSTRPLHPALRALALAPVLGLAACAPSTPVHEEHQGELTDDDARIPDDDSPYDLYTFRADAGWRIRITMESDDFDAYLWLHRPDNATTQVDDARDDSTDAAIELVAPSRGEYVIRANSQSPAGRGAYRLTIDAAPPERTGEGADESS